ncbi:MAG: hypothetical protein KA116_03390 [Proteobacteria bacterium]|nr:hypothetical protein [Pseudomonadota bacterium]
MIQALVFLISLSAIAYEINPLELLSREYPKDQKSLFRNLKAGQALNTSYDFDANREPQIALQEGLGGQCNTHARVAALTLMKNGISPEDIRIVSAINNLSLDKLCLGLKGKSANPTAPNDGLGGHVFLLVKSEGKWFLVNTTTIPGTAASSKLGPLGLEYIPYLSPDELGKYMNEGPVLIPSTVTQSMPKEFSGPMTIFSSIQPDKYPLNDFKSRRNFVASGNINSDICKYDGAGGTMSKNNIPHYEN